MVVLLLVLVLVLVSAAAAFNRTGSCDPLDPSLCAFPYPSSFYEISDDSTASGRRLVLDPESLPYDTEGLPIDAQRAGYNNLDGWSIFPGIMTYFADVSIANFPPHWDAQQSMHEDCPIVLLDTSTGERVPLFAEVDRSTRTTSVNALMVWPLAQLKFNTRYIVAMRSLVKMTDGSPVDISPGFASLRDNTLSSDPDIEGRRAIFEEIFALLSAAGIARSTLQISWDFHTMTGTTAHQQLLFMRDDAFARVTGGIDDAPSYAITSIVDDFSEDSARRIQGVMRIPHYCNTADCAPGSFLVIDSATGNPVYQGLVDVTFTVVIPRSAVGQQGRVVFVGHGLFGSQNVVEQEFMQAMANRLQWGAMIAVDWWGMCSDDVAAITLMMMTDLADFKMIPDRSSQGMVNALLATRLAIRSLAADPALLGVIDVSLVSYMGNSQGGIFGLVYMALSQDVVQGGIGVPGLPYSLMLPRSVDFVPFDIILKDRYPDPLAHIFLLSMMQNLWDRTDPSSYANAIAKSPLPNTRAKNVIMHYALGDAQVHYLACYAMARSVGAQMFTEHGDALFGFEFLDADTPVYNQSMVVGYYYDGTPSSPLTNIPPPSLYDTHSYVRRETAAQDQIDLLFRDNVIVHNCDGPCVRENAPREATMA